MGDDVCDGAQDLLKRALGSNAEFRDGQLEAIVSLVAERRRLLVVQRTGWGKSVVYFLASRLLRDRGAGVTILISPLLSLMRDQRLMADRLGVVAETINSTNTDEWDRVEAQLAEDGVDLLLVSPERLANERFQETTLRSIRGGIGLFVVDEAHCISDWGHDFRPDYQRIQRIVSAMPSGVPVLATTATANDRVVADIAEQLGPALRVVRGPLTRDSLRLHVVRLDDQAERLAWLAEHLPALDGSGIVYTLTVADAIRVSAWLTDRGIDAPAYYGAVPSDEREELEGRLRRNDVKALVATVALGMGFDKPDLGFVVHFQRPGSAVAYYQQIGRAGRAVDCAEVVLLSGKEDDRIAEYFIASAFPSVEVLQEVVDAITAHDSISRSELEAQLNHPHGVVVNALKALEVDNAIFREGGRYIRSPNPWAPDHERSERVSAERRREQARMQEYERTDGCLMEFLASELDDPDAAPCGRCMNCAGVTFSDPPDAPLVRDAALFLRRAHRPIDPRRRWPGGLDERAGVIPAEHRLDPGLALCVYGDAGWGSTVLDGKFIGGQFSDELVDAVSEMIERDLNPAAPPTWLTAVPSLRHPDLVPDFVRRLALRLGLPYRAAIVKIRQTAQQKNMENSAHQVRNVLDAFDVDVTLVESGPVLLVDDIVDSRWSMTMCGVLLREAGSGPVIPIALAQASGGAWP